MIPLMRVVTQNTPMMMYLHPFSRVTGTNCRSPGTLRTCVCLCESVANWGGRLC